VRTPLILTTVLVLLPATALGEGVPGTELFAAMPGGGESKSVGVEAGFAQLGEDSFLQINPQLDLNLGIIGIGLQVPLNIRMTDNEPEAKDDYFGAIRAQDWDEPEEFLRAVRYFRYAHKGDTLHFVLGQLTANIGHGTIVNLYRNNDYLNPDTYRLGLVLDVNTDYGGVETLVSDTGRLFSDEDASKVVGGRLYVRPWAFVDPESFLTRLAVGTTVVMDTTAPIVDDAGAVKIDSQAVYGGDVELTLLRSAMLDITPYTDLNFIQEAGWGLHVGTLFTAKVPIGVDLTIPLRVEYRRFRSDYVPAYFSTFYEQERTFFPLTPKAHVVRALSSDDGINGYYAQTAFQFAGLFQIGAVYEGYEDSDPNLMAVLEVPPIAGVSLQASYWRTGITGADDIFTLDGRSMLVAQAGFPIPSVPFLFGWARLDRRWVAVPDPNDPLLVDYEAEDNWSFGVRLGLEI